MRTSGRPWLLIATLALVACEPTFMSRAEFDVTGEFLPGEHCTVTTPRSDFGPPANTQTSYNFGGIVGMAPPGYTVHSFGCHDAAGHELTFMLAVRSGTPIAVGHYTMVPRAVLDSVPFTVDVFVTDPAYAEGTAGAGWGGLYGHLILLGVSGTLDLTRMDPPTVPERGYTEAPHPQIEGRFRMRARRYWSSGG